MLGYCSCLYLSGRYNKNNLLGGQFLIFLKGAVQLYSMPGNIPTNATVICTVIRIRGAVSFLEQNPFWCPFTLFQEGCKVALPRIIGCKILLSHRYTKSFSIFFFIYICTITCKPMGNSLPDKILNLGNTYIRPPPLYFCLNISRK